MIGGFRPILFDPTNANAEDESTGHIGNAGNASPELQQKQDFAIRAYRYRSKVTPGNAGNACRKCGIKTSAWKATPLPLLSDCGQNRQVFRSKMQTSPENTAIVVPIAVRTERLPE
jgi:hypothetical protein